jgi:phosphatidate cytidylyltransferase
VPEEALACEHCGLLITLDPAMSQGLDQNLRVRLLTVLVLGPLLLLLLFLGPTWGWIALIAASAAQASLELGTMTHPEDRATRALFAGLGAVASLATSLTYLEPRALLTGVVAILVVAAFVPLVRLGNMSTAALRIYSGMSGPLYVGVLLGTLALMRAVDGPRYVFLTLTLAWMGDTGGYTFGRLFGRVKLYPEVSPKKTREGLLGSIVFSTGSALLAHFTYLPALSLLSALLLGFLGAVLGQAGDLVESLLKRSLGAKDSGNVLPGHGGLLDRIDALLVVSPLVYLVTLWSK